MHFQLNNQIETFPDLRQNKSAQNGDGWYQTGANTTMLKTQRLLLTLFSIVLLVVTITLAIQNLAVQVPVQFLTWVFPSVSLGLTLAITSLLLGASILLKMWERILTIGDQQKRTSRELERKDVSREEAEEKVKVLENKIQTLEKALTEALKSSQPR
jgi:hypothetical protein